MLFPGYDPFYIEGTLEPTLLNPLRAPLYLPSFGSFFSLFTSSLFSNITVLNTPSTCFAVFCSFTLISTTLNRCIHQAIACLNRQERREEQEQEE